MTAPCPYCGHSEAPDVVRGKLTVSMEPPVAFWGSEPLPLKPYAVKVLHMLAARGTAHHNALRSLFVSPCSYPAQPAISRIRQALAGKATVTNIPGWGYRLEVEIN